MSRRGPAVRGPVPRLAEAAEIRVTDWTDTFFTGLWGELQRRSYPRAETEREARFIRRALGLRKGSRVLDVPCGDGRI